MATSAKPGLLGIFQQTLRAWQADECLELGAAIAYYALFALFPLLLVVLSILGFVVVPGTDASAEVLRLAARALPAQAYSTVEETLRQLNAASAGAGIVGFVSLLLAASGLFGALDRTFDKIWNVPTSHEKKGMLASALTFLREKLLAFALVLGCAALVFAAMLANLVVGVLIEFAQRLTGGIGGLRLDQAWILQGLQLAISLLLLFIALLVLYRVLPPVRVPWRAAWPGALLASVLLLLLQLVVSSSLINIGASYQSYGVVGGVMVLLLWIYLTSQIFLLGGELTRVYSRWQVGQ